MTKTVMPLLERAGGQGGGDGEIDHGSSGEQVKPVKLPRTRGVKVLRSRTQQSACLTILNRTRVRVENNPTTKISNLSSRKKLHG